MTDYVLSNKGEEVISERHQKDYKKEYIMWYKNVGGDLNYNLRQIAVSGIDTPSSVIAADINGDNLTDLIAASQYGHYIKWYRNTGNGIFAAGITVSLTDEHPNCLASADIDNDGDIDIIGGVEEKVYLYKNTGNGIFTAGILIHTTFNDVHRIRTADLDHNGRLDIVSACDDGTVRWSKNLLTGSFSAQITITGDAAFSGGFDFLDVNEDSFLDVVTVSDYNNHISYCINQSGNSFAAPVITTEAFDDPEQVNVFDMDGDNVKDLVVSYNQTHSIGWFKNLHNGNFGPRILVTDAVTRPKSFIAADIDNDGKGDVISTSYIMNEASTQKTSAFYFRNTTGSYEEIPVNFQITPCLLARTADLNNDGFNDIISIHRSIVWNENHGDGTFSAYKLISETIGITELILTDFEITDLDNDGDQDIVSIGSKKLEAYLNQGNEKFTLGFTVPYSGYAGREIEVADLNGDNIKDIIVTYLNAPTKLVWYPGIDGSNFGSGIFIDYPLQYFSPTKFKCTDVDSDGDMDMVMCSREFSRLYYLENDGNENFTFHTIAESLSTENIAVADFDNDGDPDIINADDYNLGMKYLANNNGIFSTPVLIQNTSANSLVATDVDNDGKLDIVASEYNPDSPSDQNIVWYRNNGTLFDAKAVLYTFSLSDATYITAGDVNNDNKSDILAAYYNNGKVSYFLNASTLEIVDIGEDADPKLKLYPVPFSAKLHWNNGQSFDITVFTAEGKIVSEQRNCTSEIDLETLPAGVYFVRLSSGSISTTRKVIKR
jgi:hypothetical protein